jgi:hypothetical protein
MCMQGMEKLLWILIPLFPFIAVGWGVKVTVKGVARGAVLVGHAGHKVAWPSSSSGGVCVEVFAGVVSDVEFPARATGQVSPPDYHTQCYSRGGCGWLCAVVCM